MTAGLQGQGPRQKNCPGAATASTASSGAYASRGTAPEHGTPGPQARNTELTRLLNADRLATYLRACRGDQDQALRLYAWNIEVASAFWGSFNVLGVALRNVIHAELGAFAGQDDWWNTQIVLHQFERSRVADAIGAAQRTKGTAALPGHVVAELSFGFWTGLLANRYRQRLWVPMLHAAFPIPLVRAENCTANRNHCGNCVTGSLITSRSSPGTSLRITIACSISSVRSPRLPSTG